ncbi:alkene reductase [Stappia sp. MMSF_3263]|uniref:alkene reductase n=1 Tax=Stappia sp. MMSF_3263 TaxID=3046693 RepID=UPI00273ECDD6|nr:alkene reductase [Stappia sp. MMSF_3263]
MTSSLFDPLTLGDLSLPHRIAMAPMTRARSIQPGNVPSREMARYYAQRASAATIITEATQISPQGQGYSFTPGIHSDEQVAGWRLVTDAVHAAGGRIVLQLWHVGRMSHAIFHEDGLPVAPSALAPDAKVWIADPATGETGMVDSPVPRALETSEIDGIVKDFAKAATNAMTAGFDGVEIHGANGYLIDQFLRRSSNLRDDRYGGSQENRIRFLVEVAEAVAAAAGPGRTGIRLSPVITQRGMADTEIIPTMLAAARELDRIGLAYIHLAEADWDDAPETPESFRHELRAAFSGRIIVAGKYDKARADNILARGLADVVAFGRPFIANPDLPRRLRENLPLASFDPATLFGGDEQGYSTYPAWGTAA